MDDDMVSRRASSSLHQGAAAAIALGLLQFCCNPCFIVTIMAGGASMNALRLPRQLEITLDEDYPAAAGSASRIAGMIGLGLVALRLLFAVLSIGLVASGNR